MSFKKRATELNRVSVGFEKSGFPTTAKWIRQLAQDLLTPGLSADVGLRDLDDLYNTFRSEYIGSDKNWRYREQCFEELKRIFNEVIKTKSHRTRETIDRLLSPLKIGTETLENIAEIYQTVVVAPKLSSRRKFYGICFIYMLFVEGLFDEVIRMLYILNEAGKDKDVKYEDVENKSPHNFKGKIDSIFLEGYDKRLRNSIAHARFKFDQKTGKMIFQDIKTKKQPEYKKSLSLEEFGINYYDKIADFCRLMNFYMLLLGVRDLIFSPTPFGRT
jgi:hypothetical protein